MARWVLEGAHPYEDYLVEEAEAQSQEEKHWNLLRHTKLLVRGRQVAVLTVAQILILNRRQDIWKVIFISHTHF